MELGFYLLGAKQLLADFSIHGGMEPWVPDFTGVAQEGPRASCFVTWISNKSFPVYHRTPL